MECGVLGMLIRLEHKGRIIHETGSEALTRELVIGRSHACDWPIPHEDGVASSQHAALFKKGKHIWLKDLGSTNGTFFNGKRIEKRRLVVGDKISLGNCVLSVDPDRGGMGSSLSEIVVLTGKTRGQRKQLVPPVFKIGSDPTSSLVFLDMLVSRQHAEILIKEDGSCWVRDMGSKNGTSVNGTPLRDDKERLLKDSDRIACAHFELEFHDGAVKRSNRQTWLRVAILVITLLAGMGGYQAYQRMKPSADAFVKSARRMAASEAFDEALATVDQAVGARQAARHQVAIEELRRLIGVWKNTRALWQSAQTSLEKSNWVEASRALGLLQSGKREVWEWNAEASQAKEQATKAKALLDAYLQTDMLLGREDPGFEELSRNQQALTQILERRDETEAVSAYLVSLNEEARRLQKRLSELVAASGRLEESLDRLVEAQPPFDAIIPMLEQASLSHETAMKRRAQLLIEPIKALAQSYQRLVEASGQVSQMNFSQAANSPLDLPSADACAIDPRVSKARQMIEAIHANLKRKSIQAATLFGEVEKRVAPHADTHAGLQALRDPEIMEKVFACDSINGMLPKRSRQQASGEYDQLLGVEAFYAYLRALPEPLDNAILADLPFEPLLNQAREAIKRIETVLAFIAQPDNQWMNVEKLGTTVQRLERILKQRDDLVTQMVTKAESSSGRRALIAGGIAARLTIDHTKIKIKGLTPEEWLVQELAQQRVELIKLNEGYTLAPPTRQIEIRNEILEKGLPGDPLVRRMWAMKDAAAAMSPSH